MYFLQTTIYTGILYMVYLLLLKNRTSHNWSRAYLLMNMLLPFLLPFISFPALQTNNETVSTIVLPVVYAGTRVSQTVSSIGIAPVIYIAISFTLLGYLVAQAVQIMLFIKRHTKEQQGNIQLIRSTSMGPGSWFSYVFIPEEDTNEAVLEHEIAHVTHKHSYDVILSRLLLCFAWPNVLLWLLVKELKTVHEFQADAVAGSNRDNYGASLLNELFHTKHFALSHTFFHHPIKRRIMMLQNKARTGKLKVVTLSVVLIGSILFAQCAKDSKSETSTTGKPAIERISGPEGVKEFDQAPEFDGNLMEFLGKNIVYPKSAQDRKIEGKVMLKLGIDENGNLATVDVLKSPDESLTKAALDVINKMPKWKPGMKDGKPVKASLMLPISYKLQ